MLSRRDVIFRLLAGVGLGGAIFLRESVAGPATTDRYGDKVQTVPRGELPEFARGIPSAGSVYRFATEHAADLEYVPCFCGCKNIGHRNNRDCYIKNFNADNTVTYTSHGAT